MALPVATCRLTVKRPGTAASSGVAGIDTLLASYDLPTDEGGVGEVDYATVRTGLRGHIGSPSGTESLNGGDREILGFRGTTDPFAFQQRDQIVDERTGTVYEVQTAALRDEIPAMAHVQLSLLRLRGLAA